MRTILHCFVVLAVLQVATASQNPYGNPSNPPSYPVQQPGLDGNAQPNEQDRRVPQQPVQQVYQGQRPSGQQPSEYDQQQQYQYMLQQQQQQRAMGAYPPTGYIPGRAQQDAQGPGLFSKLKNSLYAAGSAISDSLALSSLDGTPVNTPLQGQGFYGNTGYPAAPNRGQVYNPSQPRYPADTTVNPYEGNNVINNVIHRDPRLVPRLPPQQPQPQQEGSGLMGRFKSMFGLDDASSTDTSAYSRAVFPNAPVGGRPLPPHLVQQQAQQQGQGMYGQYPYTTSTSGSAGSVGSGEDSYQSQYYKTPYPSTGTGVYDTPTPTAPTADTISTGISTPDTNPSYTPYSTYTDTTPTTTPTTTTPTTTTTPPTDPLALISPEPQVFIHQGSIVMILRPREFARKKALFTSGGSEALQVFSDFERVLTQFNTASGDRALTSAELLETSGAVADRALQLMGDAAEEFEALSLKSDNLDHAAFENLSAKCQGVLCKEGRLHIGAVPQVARALSPRLGLRPGWSEALHSLSNKGVPTYLFSSCYGDVVTQVLLQGLNPSVGPAASPQHQQQAQPLPVLPQNLRVISNFFRAAPDGTVRAFSQPIVHERNKNATTAAAHMGMEVLSRPYALVLGSHENDVHMTQGVEGLKEQISVGFLELSEDLPQRLPVYLSTFDAVVIGDGNFEFVRSLIDDILQIPNSGSSGSSGSGGKAGTRTTNLGGIGSSLANDLTSGLNSGLGSVSSAGQGIALGLRNRIGALLNAGTVQTQAPPQQGQGQYNPALYNSQQQQPVQGQYGVPPRPAQQYPPMPPLQQQQHQNQQGQGQGQGIQGTNPYHTHPTNTNTAATVSSGMGSAGSGNGNVDAKPPAYLDFNEYQ